MFDGLRKLLEAIRDFEIQTYWRKWKKSLAKDKNKEEYLVTN